MQSANSRFQLFRAIVLLVLANLLWAGQGVAVKMLNSEMTPIAIALLPLYLVTLLLAPLILTRRQSHHNRLGTAWRHRNQFIIAGVGGQFVAQAGMTLGISRSLAANGAILNLLVPILSAFIASLLLRERLTLLRVGALLFGLAGVVLLSPTHWSSSFAPSPFRGSTGNLLIVCGCLGSAFYNVYSKQLLNDFSEVDVLFFSYVTAALFSIPLLFSLDPHCLSRLGTLMPRQWIAFSFLAIFMYGVSMLLFLHALRYVNVIVASASLYLVPIFGVFLAVAMLGERISPQTFFGFGVVLLGMLATLRNDYAV
jgi:drug/metabolite transporter (DMT)-like permease